jgi:hypothetical protein
VWGIENSAAAAVVGDMTASPDLAPVDSARIRACVARMRAAILDGSLHHHAPEDVPAGRRSHAVDVVRAWVAGEGPEDQRRRCGVCSPEPVAPQPRTHR